MKNMIILLLSLAFCATGFAQTFSITVNLEDLDNEKGTVQICLMNNEKQYLRDCYVGKTYRFAANKPKRQR